MAYTAATPATLKLRFPEFDSVDDTRIQYWLDDARARIVLDSDWTDPNGTVAQMLVAAHNLALGGALADSDTGLPLGVTSMRSGSLSLSFDTATVVAQAEGGWGASRYGAQFLALLKLTKAGPRVTTGQAAPCWGGSYLSGMHPSW